MSNTDHPAVTPPAVRVQRASDRYTSRAPGIETHHLFSFGEHYDPTNTHFGLLVAVSDHVMQPGAGFAAHHHSDLEIVTWVLSGSLAHEDSTGHAGVLHPGLVQCMTAGAGVTHSETNDAWRLTGTPPHDRPTRFVQMWITPGRLSLPPNYQQRDMTDRLHVGGLVAVATGQPRSAGSGQRMTDERGEAAVIRIHQPHATLHAARLGAGAVVELPRSPYVFTYVPLGSVHLTGAGELSGGDSARITNPHPRQVAPRPESPNPLLVSAGPAGAEVLVWEMHATLPAPHTR